MKLPNWVRPVWGAVVVALNTALLFYVLTFAAACISALEHGPANPLSTILFSQFWAMILVALFIGVGGLLMQALSFTHLVLSELPPEVKTGWTVVLFMLAQPAQLAYWWFNVRGAEEQ